MDLRPDLRHVAFPVDETFESHTTCRKCGATLVVLPEDRRQGFCFDCFDILDTFHKHEVDEGIVFSPSLKNGF